MGFFSWKRSDGETVWNKYSEKGPTPCVLVTDKNERIPCDNYAGYGVFGGVDYYVLLDEMNGGDGDRDRGIDLELHGGPGVRKPKITPPGCTARWEDLPDPEICPSQGYFNW